MTAGAYQTRKVPDLFHENPLRSSVLSLFTVLVLGTGSFSKLYTSF
jgi:hypothetical protein